MKHTFKIICILLFLHFSTKTSAQLKISTTNYKGVSYKVYPVRMLSSVPYRISNARRANLYNDQIGLIEYNHTSMVMGEEILPFIPFRLENGRYLAFYAKHYSKLDKKTDERIYQHEDTTKVAVIFDVKNNQKHGEAIWYDYFTGKVIQTGKYLNDQKSGKWMMEHGDYRVDYQYQNNLLRGTIFRYKKDQILSEQEMQNGIRHGLYKTFDEKGKLKNEEIYETGNLVFTKNYKPNGQLLVFVDHRTNLLPDDTLQKSFFLNTNKLQSFEVLLSDTSLSRSVSYYSNGQLRSETIMYRDGYYHANSPEPSAYSALAEKLNWSYSKYWIKTTQYHENGRLETAFDFSTFTEDSAIRTYNIKGKLLQEGTIYPMPADTINKWFKVVSTPDYLKLTKGRHKKDQLKTEISHSSLDEGSVSHTNKRGQVTTFNKNEFLDYNFADSIGVAFLGQTEYGFLKRNIITTYYILHTNKTLSTLQIGKRTYRDFAVYPYGDEPKKQLMVSMNEYSKTQDFVVEHQKVISIPNLVHQKHAYLSQFNFDDLLYPADTIFNQVRYKGELYTGELHLKIESGLRFPYKTHYNKHSSFSRRYYLEPTLEVTGKYGSTGMYSSGSVSTQSKFLLGRVYRLTNSYLNNWVIYNDGKKEGEQISDFTRTSANYLNGQKHGLERTNETNINYFLNKYHGEYVEYDCTTPERTVEYQPSRITNYNMDTMQGWYMRFADVHLLKEKVFMDRGIPHGSYWSGNVMAPTSIEATLHQGFLVDTAFYYFNEGNLKVSCEHQLADSEFYAGSYVRLKGFNYRFNENESETSFNINSRRLIGPPDKFGYRRSIALITFDANRTGNYVYYYKNGVISQKGRVENGYRVGTWEFWDLNGGRMKTITYERGNYISPQTGDTVEYFGKIEMWYPNGKPLLTGLVISEFTQFKCDQEMEVNFENVYYLTQFDTKGKQILEDNSGQVFEYHNNGLMRLEGSIKNGKREGVWKFYDPDGRLEEFGNYMNGNNDGLWIKGDLEAVPHYYDRCLPGDISPMTLPPLNEVGYVKDVINISETLFVEGVMISWTQTKLLPLFGDFDKIDFERMYGHADF